MSDDSRRHSTLELALRLSCCESRLDALQAEAAANGAAAMEFAAEASERLVTLEAGLLRVTLGQGSPDGILGAGNAEGDGAADFDGDGSEVLQFGGLGTCAQRLLAEASHRLAHALEEGRVAAVAAAEAAAVAAAERAAEAAAERFATAAECLAVERASKLAAQRAAEVVSLHEVRVQEQVSQCVAAIEQRDATAWEQRDWMHAVVESVEAVSLRLSTLEDLLRQDPEAVIQAG